MNTRNHCGLPATIPNQSEHTWVVYDNDPIFPFTSDQLTSITGYILNNSASTGPVSVQFLRGGTAAPPLSFTFNVQSGEYRTFTVIAIDTIKISTSSPIAMGQINLNINFHPY